MINILIFTAINKNTQSVKTKLIRPLTLWKKDVKIKMFQKKERSTRKKNSEKKN